MAFTDFGIETLVELIKSTAVYRIQIRKPDHLRPTPDAYDETPACLDP